MKEKLEEELKKIGWSIKGRYPNSWIYDHKNKRTNYRVMDDRIEVEGVSENTIVAFYFKDCEIKRMEDAVAVGTKEQFILFMNHDLTKPTL